MAIDKIMITGECIHHKFLMFEYWRVGSIVKVSIFKKRIYARVGEIKEYFGFLVVS